MANPEIHELALSFSLTHTRSVVAVAVSCSRAIGVDLETSRPLEDFVALAKYALTECEFTALAGLDPVRRHAEFLRIWTLKESYIKARGLGLSIPLQQIEFRLEADSMITMLALPGLRDSPARWRFWQFQDAGAIIALCTEDLGRHVEVVTREIVPLVSEQERPLTVLGASHGRECGLACALADDSHSDFGPSHHCPAMTRHDKRTPDR